MKAVVMAGGEGTRLRPMTANQPKPMLPVVNRPIMEHVLRLLKRHGFTETVVTVQFLASLVRNYFGDGEDFGLSLQYATEESPLGTAGSVRNAADALRDEPFLVISGDALTDIDLSELVRFHKRNGALVTVALSRVPNPLEFGIVITGEDGRNPALPGEAHLGAGVLGHGEHRHLRDAARGAGRGARRARWCDWSGRRVPPAARARRPAVRLGGRRATGRTSGSHESYLKAQADVHVRPGGRRHRRLRGVAGRVGGRGRRGRSRGGAHRPAGDRRVRQDRGRRDAARVHRDRQQRGGEGGRVPAPRGRALQRLHRPGRERCAAA